MDLALAVETIPLTVRDYHAAFPDRRGVGIARRAMSVSTASAFMAAARGELDDRPLRSSTSHWRRAHGHCSLSVLLKRRCRASCMHERPFEVPPATDKRPVELGAHLANPNRSATAFARGAQICLWSTRTAPVRNTSSKRRRELQVAVMNEVSAGIVAIGDDLQRNLEGCMHVNRAVGAHVRRVNDPRKRFSRKRQCGGCGRRRRHRPHAT